MAEENRNTSNVWRNKTLIIAVAAVLLVVIFMYFRDQKQQRTYELERLEQRVGLLEEWGGPRQSTPPPESGLEVVETCNNLDLKPKPTSGLDVGRYLEELSVRMENKGQYL